MHQQSYLKSSSKVQHKGLGIGKFVRSATFTIDGYEWCIVFYPDGSSDKYKEYVSVFLQLVTKKVEVRAGFDMSLVMPHDPDTTDLIHQSAPMAFSEDITDWGLPDFEKRTVLESSPYLHDDRLVIMCEVTVLKEPLVEETALDSGLLVPSSDLSDHLGKLLDSEEEADVTFKVKKEVFSAHMIVLAMRSPVFKAKLIRGGPIFSVSNGGDDDHGVMAAEKHDDVVDDNLYDATRSLDWSLCMQLSTLQDIRNSTHLRT
ncbi:hypothetical protein QYE76_056261 [Lolium multiflorum]|uniref:Uncharacterized protein n=1 Tax=Lolium multiflorum TaxID=4521 RepID=A0AAD8T1U6_LOLMU|nr:hypothetical protein QYE76_056261 [Lolium multiflorum]